MSFGEIFFSLSLPEAGAGRKRRICAEKGRGRRKDEATALALRPPRLVGGREVANMGDRGSRNASLRELVLVQDGEPRVIKSRCGCQ